MASDYSFTGYRASSQRAVYQGIMNSESIQKEMLRRAHLVANAARAQGIETKTDVRPTPGRQRPGRAHARVTSVINDWRSWGIHHKDGQRVDRVLQAALDAARG